MPYMGLAGQTQPVHRMIAGYDPTMPAVLEGMGLDSAQVTNVMNGMSQSLMVQLVHPAMPVIDAIHLAEFLVYATKGFFKYLPLADIVGGETEVATVTKHEGFKWIKRKHYYDKAFNLGDTDHAC